MKEGNGPYSIEKIGAFTLYGIAFDKWIPLIQF
jgi:hypothetical protein